MFARVIARVFNYNAPSTVELKRQASYYAAAEITLKVNKIYESNDGKKIGFDTGEDEKVSWNIQGGTDIFDLCDNYCLLIIFRVTVLKITTITFYNSSFVFVNSKFLNFDFLESMTKWST